MTYENAVQMEDFDIDRFRGKTFYTIIAPNNNHACSETSFLGDFVTHTYLDEKNN